MSRFFVKIYPAAIVLAFPIAAFSQTAVEKKRKLVGEVFEKSFPELKTAKIEVKAFRSAVFNVSNSRN
ncbi:MAG TPA: hypothetical protein VGC97_08490 [Pyrinomonadaceae bacterium]|jgi:hypothetical protein